MMCMQGLSCVEKEVESAGVHMNYLYTEIPTVYECFYHIDGGSRGAM